MKIPVDHIITPGGARHKSRVHRVTRTDVVHASDGAVHRATPEGAGEKLVSLGPPPAADSGSAVASAPPAGPGWIESAGFGYPDPLTAFRGSWEVPPPPKIHDHQVVFLFIGLQTDRNDGTDLLQPVLQWGFNGTEGGDYWGMSCWYQRGGSAEPQPLLVTGNYVRVEPGDRINVAIEQVSWQGIPSWECTATAEPSGTAATIRVSRTPRFRWSHVGLEAYHAPPERRGLYPGAGRTGFTGLSLNSTGASVTPVWESEVRVPGTGRRVEVQGASAVELCY